MCAGLVPKTAFVWCWPAGWQLHRVEPTAQLYLHGRSGLCPTNAGLLAGMSMECRVVLAPLGRGTAADWLPMAASAGLVGNLFPFGVLPSGLCTG